MGHSYHEEPVRLPRACRLAGGKARSDVEARYDRPVSRVTFSVLVALGLVACGGDGAGGTEPEPESTPPPTVFGGDRPVELFVPSGYDADTPTPLIILLHGHGASGLAQELVFRLRPEAEARTFLYMFPNGTSSEEGRNFWNATDACCDFFDSGVDDASYLRGLIDEVSEHYNVDDRRIYFTGHSNGGYMSFRMACDYADVIAGIAPLAGATYADPADCGASEPVHVLAMHGTADEAVLYEGQPDTPEDVAYPSAADSVAYWAEIGGCDATTTEKATIDLDENLPGEETRVTVHEGCQPGGSAELWTIEEGTHIPAFGPEFPVFLADWLLARSKP
jgi:polyhydroxybutyrate depolymerase